MTSINSVPAIPAVRSFTFQQFKQVRVVVRGGDPWFVAADVCAALEIAHVGSALRSLDDDEKGVHLTHTPGGHQNLSVINESGLYTLILRCRSATTPGTIAHTFRKWVTSEVLPAIRKTGGYANEATKPKTLGSLGNAILTSYVTDRQPRYYDSDVLRKRIAAALRKRYGVDSIEQIPVSYIHDLLNDLERLAEDAYRLFHLRDEMEQTLVAYWVGTLTGDEKMNPAVMTAISQIELPADFGRARGAALRQKVLAMLPA